MKKKFKVGKKEDTTKWKVNIPGFLVASSKSLLVSASVTIDVSLEICDSYFGVHDAEFPLSIFSH